MDPRETRKNLNELPDYEYHLVQQGDTGNGVVLIQFLLQQLGFYHGPLNGAFTRETLLAFNQLQRQHHTPVTDRMDDNGWLFILGVAANRGVIRSMPTPQWVNRFSVAQIPNLPHPGQPQSIGTPTPGPVYSTGGGTGAHQPGMTWQTPAMYPHDRPAWMHGAGGYGAGGWMNQPMSHPMNGGHPYGWVPSPGMHGMPATGGTGMQGNPSGTGHSFTPTAGQQPAQGTSASTSPWEWMQQMMPPLPTHTQQLPFNQETRDEESNPDVGSVPYIYWYDWS